MIILRSRIYYNFIPSFLFCQKKAAIKIPAKLGEITAYHLV